MWKNICIFSDDLFQTFNQITSKLVTRANSKINFFTYQTFDFSFCPFLPTPDRISSIDSFQWLNKLQNTNISGIKLKS